MILSRDLEKEFMLFIRDFLERHLCETDKTFFRHRQDVNGCISAMRNGINDPSALSVVDEIFQCSSEICQYQMMCAMFRGISFGVDYQRSYESEDGNFADISGYSGLIFIDDYMELQRQFSTLELKFRSLVSKEKFLEYKHCIDNYVLISKYIVRQSFNLANNIFLSWEKKYCGSISHL